MKKTFHISRSMAGLAVILLMIIFVSSCATGGKPVLSGETAVVTYEGVALGLNTVKAYIKGKEVSGQLKGEELDGVIAQWEEARKLFIEAGEALKMSIAAKDLLTQQRKLEAYNTLLQKAAFELGKLDYLKGGT
jgi:hypothetical protein